MTEQGANVTIDPNPTRKVSIIDTNDGEEIFGANTAECMEKLKAKRANNGNI